MKRTVYRNRFLVDQIMLNYTETSKIEEILERQRILGSSGIYSGLLVSTSSLNTTALTVSPGIAVMPSGEIVELSDTVNNLSLADSTNQALNVVYITYSESGSNSQLDELGDSEENLFIDTTGVVLTATVEDFINITPRDNILVIALAYARGSGISLQSTDIVNATVDLNTSKFSQSPFNIMKGIVIKGTTVNPVNSYGYIIYDFSTNNIGFVSPNNPDNTGPANIPVRLGRNRTNVVLEDPDIPGDSITVDIYGEAIPASTSSINFTDLTEYILDGTIVGNIVTERIDFSQLYEENLFDISDDVRISIPKSTANDNSHRDIVGNSNSTPDNPHGLALLDLIKVFESLKGSIDIGSYLLANIEEGVYPRVRARASTDCPYLLMLETEVPGLSSDVEAPVRLYCNSFNPENITGVSDVNNQKLSGTLITFNARYSLEDNTWIKDNEGLVSIRVELNVDSFNVSLNNEDSTFSDSDGWRIKLLNNVSYTLLNDSLALVSTSNDSLSDRFTAALNVGSSFDVARPNMVPLYEDLENPNGAIRIYIGNNQAGTLGGDGRIEFLLNAKPNLGVNTWTKDLPANITNSFLGNSYRLSYNFAESSLSAYEYTGDSLTFSTWDPIPIKLLGGIETSLVTPMVGNYRVDNLVYESPVSRILVVNHGDVGYVSNNYFLSIAAGRDIDNADRYFQRDTSNTEIMGAGLPAILDVENRRKNIGQQSNTPRLVWRGPERDVWKSDDDYSEESCFIGTKSPSANQEITFIFPIDFEEDEILIRRISIPWDWENSPTSGNGIDTQNFFNFQDDYNPVSGGVPFFRIRLYKTDLLTGNIVDFSPSFSGLDCISYIPLISRTPPEVDEMVIEIAHPSGWMNDYLVSLSKEDLLENEVFQLHVSTNNLPISVDEIYGLYGLNTPSSAEGQIWQFRPIIIGNCVVEYETFNVE